MRTALFEALAARPLLALAAAVVGGSAAGSEWALSAGLWRAFVCATLAAWLAALIALRARPAVAHVLLLGVCLAAAGLRADVERAALERTSTTRVQQGVLDGWRTSDAILGRLGDSDRTFALPIGAAATGDLLCIDPVHEPAEWASGPVIGPRRAAGRVATVDVTPDEIARIALPAPTLSNVALSGANALRCDWMERLATLREDDTRALVTALLFGDTSTLAVGLPDLFVRTGTFHVLAVSGMQVVLVLLFFIGPASRVLAWVLARVSRGRVRPAREWFALPLLLLFVPIAGGGAPIVRSALGGAFGLLAPHFPARRPVAVEACGRRRCVHLARRADALSCLALALVFECLLHPSATQSLSVQLSYAATAGLIVGTGPCLALLRRFTGSVLQLPARVSRTGRARALWIVLPLEKSVHAVQCAVAASCAAVFATLPFTWTRLGEWSPWGVLATPVLGPPTTILFVGGWLRVAFGPWVPEAALDACAHAMIASMQWFDALPCTPAPLPPRPEWLLCAACALTFAALRGARRRAFARCAALAWASVLVPWSAPSARVTLHALDVGAGTAVVVEGGGLGTWVFDAGSRSRPDVAREALGPLLRSLEPSSIGIVLSHADRDHDGALGWLIDRYPPQIFAGALPAHLAERLPHTTRTLALTTGEMHLPPLGRGGAAAGLVLQRALATVASDNEGSYSLLVRAGGEQALLCGDAEKRGLDLWLARYAPPGPLDVVLWPHHGSDSDRLDALVRTLRPREAWISAGGRPPALAELERRAIVTWCTARDGWLQRCLPGGTRSAQTPGRASTTGPHSP
ncbi:MAG: ComEC/Rec2 family competence protein [Planctomycetes bacterium]|nr:ComEC/Rec2 family competence protein [Planctomycetota bacterium]